MYNCQRKNKKHKKYKDSFILNKNEISIKKKYKMKKNNR